ncbi:MAG: hypothetical protein OXE52_00620 [Chloroflexi bacterium]|nr:hypothetical protein [Chloroflexota bacterium]
MTMRRILGSITLLLILTTSLPFVSGQGEVCSDLQEMYVSHGEELVGYLSAKGQQCLESPPKPTEVPVSSPIFEESGRGDKQISVDISFVPGIYRLNLVRPLYPIDYESSDVYVNLDDIIEVPDDCISTSSRYTRFPSQIEIGENCRVYATLSANAYSWSSNVRWEVSITEYVPQATAALAEEWTGSGRGSKYDAFDLMFSPGIYRINLDTKLSGDWGSIAFEDILSTPPGCFGSSYENLPYQVRIRRDCQVYGILHADLDDDYQGRTWKASITKLS